MRNKVPSQYKIQNQVKSCGFRIDFVVVNGTNGKRLAVECDGPTHFKNEIDEEYGIYVDSDEERQAVLEAAGWTFHRLKYCDWIDEHYNREKAITEIIKSIH